jgi:signal peptidase I
MILLRRINGNSMHPTLCDGDYIIAHNYFLKTLSIGDIVIVDHPIYGEIIKRLSYIDNADNLWLVGDGTDTLSSQKMGAIPRSALAARMIWHIKGKD